MRIKYVFLLALLFCCESFSDARQDAEYIVSQTVTQDILSGTLSATAPVLSAAISNDLKENNIEVSDLDAFTKIFFEELLVSFTDSMQKEAIQIYLEQFSDTELKEIAKFYRTDTGQSLIRKTPELMRFGAEKGAEIGELVAIEVLPTVLGRLAKENIVITKKKDAMQQ